MRVFVSMSARASKKFCGRDGMKFAETDVSAPWTLLGWRHQSDDFTDRTSQKKRQLQLHRWRPLVSPELHPPFGSFYNLTSQVCGKASLIASISTSYNYKHIFRLPMPTINPTYMHIQKRTWIKCELSGLLNQHYFPPFPTQTQLIWQTSPARPSPETPPPAPRREPVGSLHLQVDSSLRLAGNLDKFPMKSIGEAVRRMSNIPHRSGQDHYDRPLLLAPPVLRTRRFLLQKILWKLLLIILGMRG